MVACRRSGGVNESAVTVIVSEEDWVTDDTQAQEFNLYTIGMDQPFLEVLCAKLWEDHQHDPLSLSDVTIFLPTRRAVRSFTEIFLDHVKDDVPALLLPSLKTLGGIEEGDLSLERGNDLLGKKVVSRLERELVLANFIYQRDKSLEAEGPAQVL